MRVWHRLTDIDPGAAALVLALGLVLGTFPVYGCPTLLCLAAAVLLRLNVAALQAMNQVTAPLQFLLFVPHARLGAWILGRHDSPAIGTAAQARLYITRAIAGWLCFAVPVGVLLYCCLSVCLRWRARGRRPGARPAFSPYPVPPR